jgi:alpha-amylase
MPDVCLYFQVHQPNRLLPRPAIAGGGSPVFVDDAADAAVLDQVADHCYLPANRLFARLIERHGGRFRIALSLSGTVIEQMSRHRPDVLESFQALVAGGGVELLAETWYHSLAFLHSNREFDRQVDLHLEKMEELFHIRPRVFRNTELIYNDAIAAKAETMGFDGVIAEGVADHLAGQSPNFLYRAPGTARIRTLLRSAGLSDDLGFRLTDETWSEHPLTPEKFASWMAGCTGDVVNLFMGYETLGGLAGDDPTVLHFWETLPDAMRDGGLQWVTPSEAVDLYRASREYACPLLTSWTDLERDLSAWEGNPLQREALARVHGMEKAIHAAGDPDLLDAWAKLQTSNHFHWMSTKGGVAGGWRSRVMPYRDPADAHARFMAALDQLEASMQGAGVSRVAVA